MYNCIINERETMRDTKNEYQFIDFKGVAGEITSEQDLSEWFIDQYYKGRLYTFWVNGVEWKEPTA